MGSVTLYKGAEWREYRFKVPNDEYDRVLVIKPVPAQGVGYFAIVNCVTVHGELADMPKWIDQNVFPTLRALRAYLGRSFKSEQHPVYVVKDVHGCFAIEPEHHGLTLVVWSERSEDAKTFNTREEAQARAEQLKQLGFKNVAGVSPV